MAVPTAVLRTLAQTDVTANLQRIEVEGLLIERRRHRIADLHPRIMPRCHPLTGAAPLPPITAEAVGTRVAEGTPDAAKLRTHETSEHAARR